MVADCFDRGLLRIPTRTLDVLKEQVMRRKEVWVPFRTTEEYYEMMRKKPSKQTEEKE